ncbi:hypothetical protein, partial [Flexivirga endophytica]
IKPTNNWHQSFDTLLSSQKTTAPFAPLCFASLLGLLKANTLFRVFPNRRFRRTETIEIDRKGVDFAAPGPAAVALAVGVRASLATRIYLT